MHTPTVLRTALLSVLVSLAGCDKVVTKLIKKGAEAAVQASQAGQSDDDRLGEKLGGYIHCINVTARQVERSISRYFDWVDAKVGPTGQETQVWGLFEITEQQYCLDGITKSAELDPDDAELEASAAAFATALQTLVPIVNEVHRYYDDGDYKDDAFADGKALHPKLVAAFETFQTANADLRTRFAARNDALQERELETVLKEQGRRLLFHSKNVMAKAKALVQIADAESIEALDAATFEAGLGAYEAALDELETYAGAHPKEADSILLWSSFASSTGELRKAGKALARRKRDGTPFSDSDKRSIEGGNFKFVEGHPGAFVEHYNDLVDASNRLNWFRYAPD